MNVYRIMLLSSLCAVSLFGLFGCGKVRPAPTTGGVTDKTDPDAPKSIKSKDVTDFRCSFALTGEWGDGCGARFFSFEVTRAEDGSVSVYEKNAEIMITADDGVLSALQSIIDRNNLAEKNGVYRLTAGLPPECGASGVTVNYASGEKLTFTVNNDTNAAWAKETYILMADLFSAQGKDELLPVNQSEEIVEFEFTCTEGNIYMNYYTVQDGEAHFSISRTLYDNEQAKAIVKDKMSVPDDYYARLSEIVSASDLRPFDRTSPVYGAGRVNPEERDGDGILRIRIEYADGRVISVDTSSESDTALLKPLTESIRAYYEEIFQ